MENPWAFGWNQVLAIIGMGITLGIAVGGFRSFSRWKREQLETRRMDIALEALVLANESKLIFDHIRSGIASEYEWRDMPQALGETDADRGRRGTFYATLKRMADQRDFFDRALRLHPRLVAIFGSEADTALMRLHQARREIEVSAEMLLADASRKHQPPGNDDFYKQLRADIWAGAGRLAPEGDRVGKKLEEFREGVEKLCRPVVSKALK